MGPDTTRQIRASPRRTKVVRMTATPLDGGALRRRLANGETTVGTFVGMASATATEVRAAASYGVPVVVRVESSERIRIGRVLDQGAAGVMVPRLDKPGEVAAVLSHLRYPPHGDRGVATDNRSCRWGLDTTGCR